MPPARYRGGSRERDRENSNLEGETQALLQSGTRTEAVAKSDARVRLFFLSGSQSSGRAQSTQGKIAREDEELIRRCEKRTRGIPTLEEDSYVVLGTPYLVRGTEMSARASSNDGSSSVEAARRDETKTRRRVVVVVVVDGVDGDGDVDGERFALGGQLWTKRREKTQIDWQSRKQRDRREARKRP